MILFFMDNRNEADSYWDERIDNTVWQDRQQKGEDSET